MEETQENLSKEVNTEDIEHSYNAQDVYEDFNVENLDFFNGYGGF